MKYKNNMQVNAYWDWYEFGFCFKFSRLKYRPDYLYQIEIHFLFFDLWISFINKI